ncbi:FCD domain-containing protein [Streptomyces sp. NPDC008137]|uniref:FadR/GntR family transcriptional regulator n=1 Tax=Streptomyces sp. NPDC008137 TaxID=3364813 RepID=UPI0036E3F8D4
MSTRPPGLPVSTPRTSSSTPGPGGRKHSLRAAPEQVAHLSPEPARGACDSVLRRAIAQAAHNGLLLRMFDTMNAARGLPVWGNIKRRSAGPERRAGYEHAHRQIVEALNDRDPGAARQHMRAHLLDVRTNLLGPS